MCWWWATTHCKNPNCDNLVDGTEPGPCSSVTHPDHGTRCPAHCGLNDANYNRPARRTPNAIRPEDGRSCFKIKSTKGCSPECSRLRVKKQTGQSDRRNPTPQSLSTASSSGAVIQGGPYSGGYSAAQTQSQRLPPPPSQTGPSPELSSSGAMTHGGQYSGGYGAAPTYSHRLPPTSQPPSTASSSDAMIQGGQYSAGYGAAQTYSERLPSIGTLVPNLLAGLSSSDRVAGNIFERIIPPTGSQPSQMSRLGAPGPDPSYSSVTVPAERHATKSPQGPGRNTPVTSRPNTPDPVPGDPTREEIPGSGASQGHPKDSRGTKLPRRKY